MLKLKIDDRLVILRQMNLDFDKNVSHTFLYIDDN